MAGPPFLPLAAQQLSSLARPVEAFSFPPRHFLFFRNSQLLRPAVMKLLTTFSFPDEEPAAEPGRPGEKPATGPAAGLLRGAA